MAIKVRENGKWVNVYSSGASTTPTGTVNLDTTLTRAGYAAEAKAVGAKLGDLTNLNTDDKSNIVAAINEVALNAGSAEKLLIVTCDMVTKTANYSKSEISTAVTDGKLIMGLTSDGLPLDFVMIGTHNTENEIAVFSHTEVDVFGNVVSNFIHIDDNKTVSSHTYTHTNPVDNITAAVGQVAKVKTVDANGKPVEWEAGDLSDAENGILTVFIGNNNVASHSSNEIYAALQAGEYVVAYYESNKNYIPLLTADEDNAAFYITGVENSTSIIGVTLVVSSTKAVTMFTTNFVGGGENSGITPPTTATIGQVLAVKNVDSNNAPIEWEAIDLPSDVEISTIDLDLLGLSAIPEDGSMVSVKIDTSDIFAAFDKGPAFLKFSFEYNSNILTGTVLANPMKADNRYQVAFVAKFGMPLMVFFVFNSASIYANSQMFTADLVNAIPIPASAAVGQTIAVKTIDENGKPIEWEVVDFPTSEGEEVIVEDRFFYITINRTDKTCSHKASEINAAVAANKIIIVDNLLNCYYIDSNTDKTEAHFYSEFTYDDGETVLYNFIIKEDNTIELTTSTVNNVYTIQVDENNIASQNPEWINTAVQDYNGMIVVHYNNFIYYYQSGNVTGVDFIRISNDNGTKSFSILHIDENKNVTITDTLEIFIPTPSVDDVGKFLKANNDGTVSWTTISVNENGSTNVLVDETLSQSGMAADAKVTGDRLSVLEAESTTYAQNDEPMEAVNGDLWIDLDDNDESTPATGSNYTLLGEIVINDSNATSESEYSLIFNEELTNQIETLYSILDNIETPIIINATLADLGMTVMANYIKGSESLNIYKNLQFYLVNNVISGTLSTFVLQVSKLETNFDTLVTAVNIGYPLTLKIYTYQ